MVRTKSTIHLTENIWFIVGVSILVGVLAVILAQMLFSSPRRVAPLGTVTDYVVEAGSVPVFEAAVSRSGYSVFSLTPEQEEAVRALEAQAGIRRN